MRVRVKIQSLDKSGIGCSLGIINQLVGLLGTVVGIQVTKVGGLAVEVNDIGKVDGVSDEPSGVHEVVGNFIAGQKRHLS